MHVAHKWSAAAELVHPFYTGVKFLPFIVSCGCSPFVVYKFLQASITLIRKMGNNSVKMILYRVNKIG